jgi:hypothetical protein
VLDKIMDLANFLQPIFWIKAFILIVIGFYAIFTFIVFTQVKTMTQILHLYHASGPLRMIAKIQIILAISLFLFAIVIL